jgi:hypothetical protein
MLKMKTLEENKRDLITLLAAVLHEVINAEFLNYDVSVDTGLEAYEDSHGATCRRYTGMKGYRFNIDLEDPKLRDRK